MDLTFNIIFTPGTVRFLKLAALSLVKFSPYRYRLVSNKLDFGERAELENLCGSSDRFEYYFYEPPYKSPKVAPHGEVLSALERANKDEFFCFMDSDIFAAGPFHEELERELAACDVFSSCRQIMVAPGEAVRSYSGKSIETPEGLAVATTFFAVYRSDPLRKVIRNTGVSFEKFGKEHPIPERARKVLVKLGLERRTFDTGKLLNVVSHAFGVRYRYREFANLHHLGGFSFALTRQRNNMYWLKFRVKCVLFALGATRYKAIVSKTRNNLRDIRYRSGTFFADYIKWLNGDGREPRWIPLDKKDEEIGRRMGTLCKVIKDLHASFAPTENDCDKKGGLKR